MMIFRQRFVPLLGLLIWWACAVSGMAESSAPLPGKLDAADVVTGHGFNIILYLPIGILLAALLLEWFAQWKGNREVEPGILFLLCSTAGAAVATALLAIAFAKVGRDAGQLSAFCTWMVVLGGIVSLAFFLKRKARDQRLFALSPPPNLTGRVVAPRTSGQKALIVGYRLALIAAILAAMAGISEMPVGNVPLKSLAATIRTLTEPSPAAAGKASIAQTPPANPAVTPAPSTPASTPIPQAPALAELIGQRSAPEPPPPATTTAAPSAVPTPATAATESPAQPATAPAAPATAASTTPPPESTPPPEPPPSPATTPRPPSQATPPASPATTPTVAATTKTSQPALEKNFFATKIKPILDSKCTSCHGSSKQKGDLRLDSIDAIRKGAGHPIIQPGNLENSAIYGRLTSPDDEDIMPPKDKGGPLPAAQIELFKRWILAGADFGDGSSSVAVAMPATPGGKVEEELSQKLPAPDGPLLTRLTDAGVIVRALSSNGALLDLNFSHAEMPQINLAELAPIAPNIFALDLTRSKLRDDQLAPVAQMKNLRRLQLNRNPITDAGLVHLGKLSDLEVLNLYETGVTDAGLDQLTTLKKLQKVFLFNTKCTPAGEKKLEAAIPGVDANLGI